MLIAHRRSTIRPERPSDIRVPPQPRCGRTLTPGSALLPTVIVYALVDARDDPATRSATRSTSTCAATTRSVISPGSSGTSRGGRRTSRCSRSNSSPAARTSRRGDPGSHPVGSRAAIRWVGSPQGRVSGVLVDDRWPSRPRYVLEVIQGLADHARRGRRRGLGAPRRGATDLPAAQAGRRGRVPAARHTRERVKQGLLRWLERRRKPPTCRASTSSGVRRS